MKILFIVGEFPKLSETFVLNQITGLIDRGHSVSILANKAPQEIKKHNDIIKYKLNDNTIYYNVPSSFIKRLMVFVIKFTKYFPKQPLKILNSLNFLKYGKEALSLRLFYSTIALLNQKNSYDIINCHFGPNGILGAFLKDIGILNGKVFTTFHGNDMTTYLKDNGEKSYQKLFEKGDIFLPISNFWKEKLIRLGCNSEKIKVHRMGVNFEKFPYVKRVPKGEAIKIVSVARLVEKKGIEYSIRAISDLLKKGFKINYYIVGDGPLKEELASLIDSCEANGNINLMGWKRQEEIIEIMRDSDLVLVPSVTSKDGDMEGIPVVIMESMAMGIPVLSTYHSGIPELITDGLNGFLVEEKNIEELKDKLEYIMNNNNLLTDISKEGRKRIEEEFNVLKLNDSLEKLFFENQ
ncbi:glycosyltransferase [Metabacillus sp. FJAT-53654]|uniref:Glycosyltransferase n=1 Tax=Metabacillus rhizosphaerae TaxID=3117747 RepID=A0ABZ2MW42_9BACI